LDPTMGGLAAAAGLAYLVGKGGKKYLDYRKQNKQEKFEKNENLIKRNTETQYGRSDMRRRLGLKFSSMQLLAMPAQTFIARLKSKDPQSKMIEVLGGIFDILRNTALNINILRMGTVGDFKHGDNVLKFFGEMDDARKKRERENKKGFLSKAKETIDNKLGITKKLNWMKDHKLATALIGLGLTTSGVGLATGSLLVAGGGIAAADTVKWLSKKIKTTKEKEQIENEKRSEYQKLLDNYSESLNKHGKPNRESQTIANLATTALPKIAEQQRVLLAKIYEVESNTFDVITKLYTELTGKKDIKYQSSKDTKERIYEPSLGEFLTRSEYKEFKQKANNKLFDDNEKLRNALGDVFKGNEKLYSKITNENKDELKKLKIQNQKEIDLEILEVMLIMQIQIMVFQIQMKN